MLGWIVLIVGIGLLAYVRLASSDPGVWHAASRVTDLGEKAFPGGYVWREAVEGDGTAQLQALDDAAMATPRTVRLAGSVAERQITYVTRSKWMGFPDYTTVGIYDGVLEINARLRFGKSDLGVNAKRVKGWRGALQ